MTHDTQAPNALMTEERLREIRACDAAIHPLAANLAESHRRALLAHLDAVTRERDEARSDLDRAIGDVMIIAQERDAARTVTDEKIERAYAAWHAFKPTPTDATGYGGMRAALVAALEAK